MNKDPKRPAPARPEPKEPKNVVDGMPDHAASRQTWRVVLIIVIFVAWLALLSWVWLAGSPR